MVIKSKSSASEKSSQIIEDIEHFSKTLHERLIHKQKKILDSILVDELQTKIYKEIQSIRPGCQGDHPSQLKHACLFTIPNLWVDLYIENALDQLNMEKAKRLFFDLVTRLCQSVYLTDTILQWL
jgi:hypothetical protein